MTSFNESFVLYKNILYKYYLAVPVTMNQKSQKEPENIESQNAALNLERLLESN